MRKDLFEAMKYTVRHFGSAGETTLDEQPLSATQALKMPIVADARKVPKAAKGVSAQDLEQFW